MQKYRKWTDQATGINPFIKPKPQSEGIIAKIINAALGLIKLFVVFSCLPAIIASFFFASSFPIKSLQGLLTIPQKIFLTLLGLWDYEDDNFRKWVEKNRGKGNLILSNSTCILDGLYYSSISYPARFIVLEGNEEKCTAISGLSMFIRILTQKQPFFANQNSQNFEEIQTVLTRQLKRGNNCILFYEGIRTNGGGTIKISTKLSEKLYKLQKDFVMVHSRYRNANQEVFSLVVHPLVLIGRCLCEWKINLKVRFRVEEIRTVHSGAELRKQVDQFLLANSSKLLQTDPLEYFRFLDFYGKNSK